METEPVWLLETASNSLVEAVLYWRLTEAQVVAAEAAWKEYRAAVGADSEHAH